jgi:hypothetical protein
LKSPTGMVHSMYRDKLCLSFACSLLLWAASSGAATADDHADVSLNATVLAQCELSDVEALPNASGTRLRVTTVCNAPSFTLEFAGVPGLDVTDARPGQNVGKEITIFSNGVRVSPAGPGYQMVEIDLVNDATTLFGLLVDIAVS